MAINFDSFTEGTTQTIQSNDYVVGFDTAVPGGERKYTVSTLANAVSGITKNALQNGLLSKLGSSVTPAADFNTFTTGSIPNATDKLVGFVSTSAGGERKWDISTIAQSISGLIQQEILNKAMTTIGNYPYLNYANVQSPSTTPQTLTQDVQNTLILNTEVADTSNIGSLNTATYTVTVPSGTYRFNAYSAVQNIGSDYIFGIYDGTSLITSRTFYLNNANGLGGQNTPYLDGQFRLTSSGNLTLKIYPSGAGTVGTNYGFVATSSLIEHITSLHLWKIV